ncbi:ABC transporter substrate-binding protein [Brevibacillus sp. TJ4]|uniref:ABC transporter substrate-binding protein n=1 Tax=Brevibacillus sp. TJ4 TaxID=3234853 RepID=UPI0037D70068
MKRLRKWFIPALVILYLTGCSGTSQVTTPQPETNQGTQQAAESAGETERKTVYPLTITDATGNEITFEKAPERIVSTSPAETEILFALGLGENVVGVSDYDDYPAEALAKPKVGGVTSPNEEAILEQSPDLVIGGISMERPVAQKLQSLGLPVYITHPSSLDEIMQNILTVGIITDRQQQAEDVVAQMKADIKRVSDALQDIQADDQKKVYIEFAPGWTVGKGEYMDELIALAKGINIAGDTEGWNQISEEKVLLEDPDVILYADGVTDMTTGKSLDEIILNRSGWDKITAIQQSQVFGLDQNILSRPGPRITQGLIEVAKAVYPDRVK